MGNLFDSVPDKLPAELLENLVDAGNVRIERIVSRGHVTPAGEWYDQDENEWVVLLDGAARLSFEDGREVSMAPGDWLDIPAHARHRVSWTDPECATVWLAVFY
jgi:cupin 2 domain-containing protein